MSSGSDQIAEGQPAAKKRKVSSVSILQWLKPANSKELSSPPGNRGSSSQSEAVPVLVHCESSTDIHSEMQRDETPVQDHQLVNSSSISEDGHHDQDHETAGNEVRLATQRSKSSDRFPWIKRCSDGYWCSLCTKMHGVASIEKRAWVTVPVALAASKKLAEKAKKHSESEIHRRAESASSTKKSMSGSNVVETLHQTVQKQSTKKLAIWKRLFNVAYFLLKNEIPHTTNWESLVSTVAHADPTKELLNYLESAGNNSHHLSQQSITGIMEAFGKSLKSQSAKDLANIDTYSIMADEATDINNRQMLSLCCRCIVKVEPDGKFEIVERFLATVPLPGTTAEILTAKILEILESYDLPIDKLVAVSFDGAANFSGEHSGVYSRLRELVPDLLYVHCRAHLLQLAVLQAANKHAPIKRITSLMNKLWTYFHSSAKRQYCLEEAQRAILSRTLKLVQPLDVRWLSVNGSLDIVLRSYAAICSALENIYKDAGDLSSDAGGLLLTLRKDSTVFMLHLLKEVMEPLARLSKALQCSTGCLTAAVDSVKATVEAISELCATNFQNERQKAADTILAAQSAGVFVEQDDDMTVEKQNRLADNFVKSVTAAIKSRFSDRFMELAKIGSLLEERTDDKDMHASQIIKSVADSIHLEADDLLAEWHILRR